MSFGADNNFGTNTHNAMKAMKGEGVSNKIRLDEICPRATNKYTVNHGDFNSIKKSISKQGLFEPIILNRIENYLKSKGNNLIKEDDRKYYEEQLKNGRKYFITSGNTRYYCFCSNCVGKDIKKTEDMNEFYRLYKLESENQIKKREEGVTENLNKFLAIDASVVDDDYYFERDRYNSANIDQRTVAAYDFIANIIDEMKDSGVYDKEENEIKNSLTREIFKEKNTTARKVNALYERILKDDLIKNQLTPEQIKIMKKGYKNYDEAKTFIDELPANSLYGFEAKIIEKINEYIQTTRDKNLSLSNIKKTRMVFNSYPKEIEKMIFNGELIFSSAFEMLAYYNNANKEIKEKIINEMKSKMRDFNPKNTLEELGLLTKKSKEKETKKAIPLSQNELLSLFREIDHKTKTVDEVLEYLKKLNLI